MKKQVFLSCSFVAIVGSAALAETISIPMSAGGSIYRFSPAFSPGGNTTIHTNGQGGDHPTFWVVGGVNIHRGWLEFDMSDLPTGACISSVSLDFFQTVDGQYSTLNGGVVGIWGNFEAGESVYDEAFGFVGMKTLIGGDVHASATDDGQLFGTKTIDPADNFTPQSIDLSAGIEYFASQAGQGPIMLTGAVIGDTRDYSLRGHWPPKVSPVPVLTIEYSVTGSPDLNNDSQVDAADLAILLAAWGTSGPADLDCSGLVDAADLAILLASWTL